MPTRNSLVCLFCKICTDEEKTYYPIRLALVLTRSAKRDINYSTCSIHLKFQMVHLTLYLYSEILLISDDMKLCMKVILL